PYLQSPAGERWQANTPLPESLRERRGASISSRSTSSRRRQQLRHSHGALFSRAVIPGIVARHFAPRAIRTSGIRGPRWNPALGGCKGIVLRTVVGVLTVFVALIGPLRTVEIRPIVGWHFDKFDVIVNPIVDKGTIELILSGDFNKP